MSVKMEDGKAGKEFPSILDFQGGEFEEKPEAKEDLDSCVEVAEETRKPAENGHPVLVGGILGAEKEDMHAGVPNSVPYDDESEIKMAEPLKLGVQQVDATRSDIENYSLKRLFLLDANSKDSDSGTEGEKSLFMKELDKFFKERSMKFKPSKLKGKGVNYLKLWRAVMKRGGYDKVTSGKLWGQVAKSFKPPKTCKAVSRTFCSFYEKGLLDFEREKICVGELHIPAPSTVEPMGSKNQVETTTTTISDSITIRELLTEVSVPGRTQRDAATRARLRWHSKCSLGNGEVSIPVVKEKRAATAQKRENCLESNCSLKRGSQSAKEDAVTTIRQETSESRDDAVAVEVGLCADEAKEDEQKMVSSPALASMVQLKDAAEKVLDVLQTQEQTLSTDTVDMLVPHLKVLMSSSAPIEVALACKRFEMVMTDQLSTFVEAKRRKITLEEEIVSTRESLKSTSSHGDLSTARSSSVRKRLAGLEDRKRELEREISSLASTCDRVKVEVEEAREELRVIDDLASKERGRRADRERLIEEMALAEMSTCQGDAALSALKTMLTDAVNRFG